LQLDEKWAFVYRKQRECDLEQSDDHRRGDCWDHVAFDPEHRLVLGVCCGKRSATRILKLLRRVKKQLHDRPPRLVTSDEFASYATVLKLIWTKRLTYATVRKVRENGRVTQVHTRIVHGTPRAVREALRRSTASRSINTSFLERHNGTDRLRNARKVRRTYRFSKDWDVHEAVTHFCAYTYNFCWCVRSLRTRCRRRTQPARRFHPRTPAMSAGLSDHVWTLTEWLSRPVPGLAN